MTITVILSGANMGDVDELDYDLWARYVAENVESATSIDAEVDQLRLGDAGEDTIVGATAEQRETLRTWLAVDGWEDFCGEAWARMRAEAMARRSQEDQA